MQGNLKPEDASNALKMFEGKFQRLKEERDNVNKAKEALELAEPGWWAKTRFRGLRNSPNQVREQDHGVEGCGTRRTRFVNVNKA